MTSAYDLTTDTGLQTYLMGKTGFPKSVRCLEGGTANYVYLVEFADSSPGVFKHAAPYLHGNNAFKFDPARMDFEAAILRAVPSIESSELAAHAIKFLDYDPDYKLLKMEWGGLQNLKLAYENPQIDMREIAYGLAKWLATLHLGSRDLRIEVPSQNVTIGAGGNNGIAVNIYRHSYNNLHAALSAYGYDSQLADHINEEFGSLLATDNECLCHGDFWPGNVLWQPSGQYSPDITGMHKSMHKLTIVDWEMLANLQPKHFYSIASKALKTCACTSSTRISRPVGQLRMERRLENNGLGAWLSTGRFMWHSGLLECHGLIEKVLKSLLISA
jgi:hypothetical protein